MRRKKTTGCLKNGQPTKTAGQQENTTTSLNFLSAEFNAIDELDDNIDNFREFESLSGITTSDMRYHEKRKQKKITSQSKAAKPEQFPAEQMLSDEAVEEEDLLSPLTIVSKGRLLIVDSNRTRAMGCAQSLQEKGMSTTVYVLSDGRNGQVLSKPESFPFIEVPSVTIDGAFGGFNPMVTGRDGRNINPSTLTGQKFDYYDLVLDLLETPCYSGTQLPVGYFAPGNKAEQIQAALEELPLMRGRFQKPQFTVRQEKSCLHGRSRLHTCRKCLDVCPVHAVSANKSEIVVDHYRCQGCGLCALICPAGAVTMRSPSQEVLLSDLIGQLPVRSDSPPGTFDIILYDRQIDSRRTGDAISYADCVQVIEIEEIGRIGLETLLLLLAHGAAGVTLTCASSRPAEMQKALKGQIELAEEILRGLHLPAESVRFKVVAPYGAEEGLLSGKIQADRPFLPDFQAPLFCLSDNRRNLIRQAAQKLGNSGNEKHNIIALPAGSPFGALFISHRCSLCMVCVGSCPAYALQSCDDMPRLSLIEDRCHQCGLCAAACPEEAIERVPRLLLDVEAAEKAVVLHEMEPFNCVECGKPFASGAMISRIQEKLKGHWMYNSDRQIRRLQMCRACRTVDALTTGDYFR